MDTELKVNYNNYCICLRLIFPRSSHLLVLSTSSVLTDILSYKTIIRGGESLSLKRWYIIMKRFFEFTEIKTKIASVLPFLLGVLYSLYAYKSLSIRNTVLFFISMIIFDMTTTALNNYIDTKSNGKELQYPVKKARMIIIVMLIMASLAGVILSWFAGFVVLLCGALCFAAGIFYTFGPVAISRMPLGEVFSGIFMGFFITFLTVYINIPDKSLVYYSLNDWVLQLSVNMLGIIKIFLLTIPAIMCIANIMLANNIRDIEHDERIGRFTLPHYIGVKNALRLFAAMYYISYVAIILMAVFKVLPIYVLAVILPIFVVYKNIALFKKNHSEPKYFIISIQNFIVIVVPLILVVAVSILI